jgi:uncharacterized damage-inducible protein DinB
MALADTLLPEFDNEMAVTRRVLERAPETAFSWRPHAKSWTLGGLGTHIAQIPHWGVAILARDGYDLVRDAGERATEKTSLVDALATFDGFVKDARARLSSATDAELMAPWSLKRDGVTMMSMPRISAFRSFAISHLIHHRGQLSVYLRLQNVPLPPIYGPTADESA